METDTPTEGSLLIGHIGDVHLRDTQYATPHRGVDFFKAFMRAIKAGAKEVDLFVLTGDNFDNSRPSPRMINQLIVADQTLTALGKKMLAITGNHDWSSPTWLSTLFPDRGAADVGIIPMDGRTLEIEGFKFHGLEPYTATKFRHSTAAIEVAVRDADVVLYHGFVEGIVKMFAGMSNPLHMEEFPISKNNKGWLLGDIHIQGFVKRKRPGGGSTLIGYPGSLEMCSKSEPQEKSLPCLRLTKDSLVVEKSIPLEIRPYIKATVRKQEDLDALMREVEAKKDELPVVLVEFDRSLPQTIARIHSVLDAQRCVIRCYPIPQDIKYATREVRDSDDAEVLGIEHFVSKRFEDDPEMSEVAMALLSRGEKDASNITSEFIEKRLAAAGVREDD